MQHTFKGLEIETEFRTYTLEEVQVEFNFSGGYAGHVRYNSKTLGLISAQPPEDPELDITSVLINGKDRDRLKMTMKEVEKFLESDEVYDKLADIASEPDYDY